MTENSPTADLLAYYIEQSPMTQSEIAQRLGYKHPNVLSMFKNGDSPVPIAKISALSKVLEIDERRFLRTALAEYHPGMFEVIESIEGQILTDNEEVFLMRLRDDVPDEALAIDSDEKDRAMSYLVSVLRGDNTMLTAPALDSQASDFSEQDTPKNIPNFAVVQHPRPDFSPGDEIAKLVELRNAGTLSQAEYEHLKAWVLDKAN